jgi:Gpi18-like mannosyltransferase
MAVRISLPRVSVTLAIAAALFWLLLPIVPPDLIEYNIPWLNHIVATGPFAAFAQPFANYNPPYLYLLALVSPLHGLFLPVTLIKLISLGGTAALAVVVYGLLKGREVAQAGRWAALVMILPTTVMNAAVLGQCDALYVAPGIAALSAALGRRHVAMLIWCGVSIAFKLQAILFAPFFIALLINRRVPVYLWLIPPVVFLVSLLPAWALGWPTNDLIGVYTGQATTFSILSMNAPNLWFVVQNITGGSADNLSDMAMMVGLGAIGIYVAGFSLRMPDGNRLFGPAILSVLITAGLLPHMHERYFLFADVAAFAFAVTVGTRRAWWIALLIQTGSVSATIGYLITSPWLVIFGAESMIFATIFMVGQSVTRRMAEGGYSSVRINTASPISRNRRNGPHAASSGG